MSVSARPGGLAPSPRLGLLLFSGSHRTLGWGLTPMLLPEKEKCIHNVAHGTAADGRPRHPRPAGGSLSSPHRGQNRGTEPRCEQRPPAGPPGLLGVGAEVRAETATCCPPRWSSHKGRTPLPSHPSLARATPSVCTPLPRARQSPRRGEARGVTQPAPRQGHPLRAVPG